MTPAAALGPVHRDFFEGGAGEERTLRANEETFARRRIVPRVLRGADKRDLRTTALDDEVSMPVLVAPTAFHRLAHPDERNVLERWAKARGIALR